MQHILPCSWLEHQAMIVRIRSCMGTVRCEVHTEDEIITLRSKVSCEGVLRNGNTRM